MFVSFIKLDLPKHRFGFDTSMSALSDAFGREEKFTGLGFVAIQFVVYFYGASTLLGFGALSSQRAGGFAVFAAVSGD